jgi:hypothetical protein
MGEVNNCINFLDVFYSMTEIGRMMLTMVKERLLKVSLFIKDNLQIIENKDKEFKIGQVKSNNTLVTGKMV